MWLRLAVIAALLSVAAEAVRLPATGIRAQAVAPCAGCETVEGGIVRGRLDKRQLALVFTAHEFAEGAPVILGALSRRGVRASFFLTGAFLRDPANASVVERLVREGHYVGAHSDGHLLYAPWTGPKTTLVSRDEFTADIERNYEALKRFGIERSAAPVFLPPYEWYTEEIASWSRALGLTLICHTRGTRSNADYTGEGTPQFVSSEAIFQSILKREREDPHGLNGFMLLLHLGVGPGRSDKFHTRFDELMEFLITREYRLVRVDQLVL
jgi:peptidoglycan/xylan/chitin deacetylase (PgdA/CDA1 family)